MCQACYDTLEHRSPKPERIVEGKKVFCAGVYSKNLQKLIRGLKYHNQRDLAYYLAKFMFEYMPASRNFTVVPVPQHPNRMKKRKYNHMDLVGEEFCKLTGCTLNTDLVRRVKDTAVQYKLSKKQRKKNLAGAFEAAPASGPILLIDDICTTGATFEEIIKEFKKHGVNDIVCLAASTVSG
jgi:ComF family protein